MITMRVLLDTNIVYDILCKRPYDEDGLLRMRVMHAFGDVELWVSSKSYTDLYYLMRRELDSKTAHELLEDTLEWVSVCSIDESDIHSALQARWKDFEDSLVHVCAQKIKADYLVTRDAEGFEKSLIPNGSASSFMDYVFRETNVRYALEDRLDVESPASKDAPLSSAQ